MYDRALERASAYGIAGVTYSLTMGVVKNIIPAIASTNALIASACVLEAVKIASFGAQTMNNYYMYMGGEGAYGLTTVLERKSDCAACAGARTSFAVSPDTLLSQLVDRLKTDASLQLSAPTIGAVIGGRQAMLYTPKPQKALEEYIASNMAKTLSALGLEQGHEVIVTDPIFPADRGASLTLVIKYE